MAPAGAGEPGHCPGVSSAHYVSRDVLTYNIILHCMHCARAHMYIIYRVRGRDVHVAMDSTMEESSQPRERRGTKRPESFVFARVTTSLCRRFCVLSTQKKRSFYPRKENARFVHAKKTKRFSILIGKRKQNHSRFIGQRKPNCVFVLFGQGKPNHSRLWRKKSKPHLRRTP